MRNIFIKMWPNFLWPQFFIIYKFYYKGVIKNGVKTVFTQRGTYPTRKLKIDYFRDKSN